MKKPIFLLPFILASVQLFAQSPYPDVPNPEWFKTIPPVDANTPDWALMMYGDDPNVLDVVDAYHQYFRENEFVKTVHVQNYKFWLKTVGEWVNGEGFIRPPTRAQEESFYKKIKKRQTETLQRSMAPWTSIGPFETYKAGTMQPYSNQVNIYSLDQSQSNPDILFAGTEAGGVYKTVDRGLNWYLTNKNEVFVGGNTAVQIHPTNPDIVLVASNNRLYRTADGGSTWTEAVYLGSSGYEIKFRPSDPDSVFCAAGNGLYLSTDAGATWPTQIFTQTCHDVDWHPTNRDTVYLLKSNTAAKRSELFMSPDGGGNWYLKANGYYAPSDPANANISGGKIAISTDDPDRVYVCLIGADKAGDEGWIGILRSNDRGENWTVPAGQYGGPYQPVNVMPWSVAAYVGGYHQGFYNFDFEASPNDADLLWIGTIRLTESPDGGASYTAIGAANSQRLSDVHADIQAIEVNGNDVWVANDGGIEYSTDNLQTFESRKNGIAGSDYWGFGAGWNEDVLVGGRYHNGNSGYYQTYGTGNSIKLGGVEESTGYVHPIENRKAFFNQYWSGGTAVRSVPDAIGGNYTTYGYLPKIPNESYVESNSSGLYFDPRYADHYYLGEGSSIWKSTDAGAHFSQLHDFGTDGRTLEIEISRKNTDYIYIVFKPNGTNARSIYRTTDGGTTWNLLTNVPTNNRNKLEISLNPTNENELWACANDGANGQKVYKTLDGGTTWTNLTTATLDGEHGLDIFYQGGTDDVVYFATRNTVFYFDQNTTDWVDYGTGLPLITKPLQLKPFYRDGKLRVATTGRGIWESTLAASSLPIAQPITYADSVFCSRDTVQFDCYSVLQHAGASWEWVFDPAPQWVSSTTARNPRVVFGANGSYDVTLTVTDGSSNSDTKSIPGMVQVEDRCGTDTIPGSALDMPGGSGNYALVPPLNLNTNTFTTSAWIKPTGIQNDWAGIVFCRGGSTTMGLNFAVNNELRYHWDGGKWSWSSGAYVPADEWSHVALVVEPGKATLYLNGVPYVNTSSHNAEAFDANIRLGNDPNSGSRTFQGQLDEVCIWQRALSQNEIRELMHLTKEDLLPTDPDLVAYFQFNEADGSQAFDKTPFGHHATLLSSVNRTSSTAPVGGGVSSRQTVTGPGVFSFGNTGVVLGFDPTATTFPNGEILAARINVPPDELPGGGNIVSDSTYWVIRNFGSNQTFDELDSLVFDGVPSIWPVHENSPAQFSIFKRNSNAFGPTWGSSLDLADLVEADGSGLGKITFAAGNGITTFSQFAIGDGREVQLNLKVSLEGPFVGGLMADGLRSSGHLPTGEPYTGLNFVHKNGGGGETCLATVFVPSGNDAIVDWLFIELRDKNDPATVLYTRSAPLQRDGDVVDMDGTSALRFRLAVADDYFVAVRHRNHLGAMTAATVALSASPVAIDFTDGSTATWGSNAQKDLGSGVFGLWASDLNASGTVDAADRSEAWNSRNLFGYRSSDASMNGVTDAADRSATWNNRNRIEQLP